MFLIKLIFKMFTDDLTEVFIKTNFDARDFAATVVKVSNVTSVLNTIENKIQE